MLTDVKLCFGPTAQALQKALALDQSRFVCGNDTAEEGRIINVRAAATKTDGDKELTPRQAAQKVKTEAKTEASRAKVEALVKNAVGTGALRQSDIDSRAIDFLCSVSEEVAVTAIQDFSSLDLSSVQNRGAFFMGLLKRRLRGDTNRKIASRIGSAEPSHNQDHKTRNDTATGKEHVRDKGGRTPAVASAKRKRYKNSNEGKMAAKKSKPQDYSHSKKPKDWRTVPKGVCFLCGKEGHLSKSCPTKA
eukprot:SAG31_NODE_655_length_13127_cov_20.616058_13_plen_248_part_00